MSITVTTPDAFGQIPSAPAFVTRFSIVLDSSYPHGGYLLGLQARVGAGRTIGPVLCAGKTTSTGAPSLLRFSYDRTADTLVSILANGSAVSSDGDDLSLITVDVDVWSY